MNFIQRQPKETNDDYGTRLGTQAAKELQGITEEIEIREITLKYWQVIIEAVPNSNARKRPRTKFVTAIEDKFPISNTFKPGYYRTKTGKGKTDRWEHLALWYATNSTDEKRIEGEIIGEEARAEYRKKLPTLPKKPVEQAIEQAIEQPQPTQSPEAEQVEQPEQPEQPQLTKLKLKDMTLEHLELDTETQEIVSNALAHSGMDLANFIKQACTVYAKTLEGKAKQHDADLSTVPTKELLNVSQVVDGKEVRSRYFTHPKRAEELVKRAIAAIQNHNINSPEKEQRWMITQTALQALTGSRPATIKNLLEQYKELIDTHNQKYELNPYDNRKGSDRKIENEINLIELVPDGLDL